MKLRWVFAAVGVVLCLVTGLVLTASAVKSAYFDRPFPKYRHTAFAAADEPMAAATPVALTRRLLHPAPAVASAEAVPPDELDPDAKEPRSEKSEGISSAQYTEFVGTEFESQTPDPAWSRDAQFELTQSLLPLLESNGSKATRVECRRDLCRFEVKNRDENAYMQTFQTALHQTVWNAGAMYTRSATDPTTMVVYLAKKGDPLPSPIPEQPL